MYLLNSMRLELYLELVCSKCWPKITSVLPNQALRFQRFHEISHRVLFFHVGHAVKTEMDISGVAHFLVIWGH